VVPLVVSRRPCRWATRLVVVLVAGLAFSLTAGAAEDVAPLETPRGSGIAPERLADLDPQERIERGLEAQHERGFGERPIQAWALLQEAQRTGDRAWLERAIAAAPDTPSVRLVAASRGVFGNPLGVLRAFGRNLPALLWLLGVVGGAVGLAVLLTAAASSLVALARTLTLDGHAIGHWLPLPKPIGWPGALGILVGLACLPWLGLGLGGVIAVAGAVAIRRLPLRQAWVTAGLLGLAGVVLGPGLDLGARLVTHPVTAPALVSTWRFDLGQPLPGDAERISRAAVRADAGSEPDPFYVYGWANALKHLGETQQATRVLQERPAPTDRLLEARAANLLGVLHLAEGNVREALTDFEAARSIGESATVLYNLSQAYARNVELLKRESLYAAARDLDPDRVSAYAVLDGANIHRYVIQEPLPLGAYVSRALADTEAARALALALRVRVLGPILPHLSWILLPLLAGIGFALRRQGLVRCRRCDRPLCEDCAANITLDTCTRCDRLFSGRAKVDVRVRRQQAELDRRQQRLLGYVRAGVALVVPGIGAWLQGGAFAGALRALVLALGVGVLLAVRWIPTPFDVGDPRMLAWVLGLALIVPVYAFEVWRVSTDIVPRGRA